MSITLTHENYEIFWVEIMARTNAYKSENLQYSARIWKNAGSPKVGPRCTTVTQESIAAVWNLELLRIICSKSFIKIWICSRRFGWHSSFFHRTLMNRTWYIPIRCYSSLMFFWKNHNKDRITHYFKLISKIVSSGKIKIHKLSMGHLYILKKWQCDVLFGLENFHGTILLRGWKEKEKDRTM